MSNLAGFLERFRRSGAMTAHRTYRIALAACVGILILGCAAPGLADKGLPTGDTPYGAVPKRAGQGPPTSPSPGRGADGTEKYSPEACAKMQKELTSIEKEIADRSNKLDMLRTKRRLTKSRLESIQIERRRIGCLFQARLDKEEIQKCQKLTKERMDILDKREKLLQQDFKSLDELTPLYNKRRALWSSQDHCERARQREKEAAWKPASVGIVPCNKLPGWTVDRGINCK